MEEHSYPEMSYREYKLLAALDEQPLGISISGLTHLLYKTQSAKGRVEEMLRALFKLGYVKQNALVGDFKFYCTDAGGDYLENAIKPLKDPS